MKKQRLFKAFSLVDDKYINEADPDNISKQNKKGKRIKIWGAVAACFCCCLIALNLWLFIPLKNSPPDVSKYADSEYYGIIVKLNEVTYKKLSYKNNFERYFGGIFKGATMEDGAAEGGTLGTSSAERYEEVTDNQTEGVIEGDLIKRSDKYIYYLDSMTLSAYSIAGEQSALVGSYQISAGEDVRYYYSEEAELYLSEDCKTVTVVYSYFDSNYGTSVVLETVDVSDPANMTAKGRMHIIGSYLSSRMKNGEFLVLTSFSVKNNPDFSDEKNFVPQIDSGNGFESVPVGDIISPEKLDCSQYTVVCRIEAHSLKLIDSAAFLSYSDNVYVSSDNIYVTRDYTDYTEEGKKVISRKMTEISCMPYLEDSFGETESVSVEGYVNDQYSMDEYGGFLRVVTTTDVSTTEESKYKSGDEEELMMISRSGDTNANLYVVDFDTLTVKAEVTAFAPEGETVKSVRFDKNIAYVCTSVQLKDPVFFFDLSELDSITVKSTGTIEGFSTSLVNMGDGYLLGIGVGDTSTTLKVEVYVEGEQGIESLCKYELENVSYSESYKSYYIDRENGLIGIGITRYNERKSFDGDGYIVISFDGYRLHKLLEVSLEGNNYCKRGVYIDGYMYMLGSSGLTVKNLG